MRLKVVAAMVLACGVYGSAAEAYPPGAPDDHFLCDKAGTAKGTAKFTVVTNQSLVDGQQPTNFDVTKPAQLCNPALVSHAVVDPNTHLEAYKIKAIKGSAKYVPQLNIKVVNEIQELTVNTKKPELLLVPTAVDLTVQPPPPDPLTHNVDHYKCYTVKISAGQPKFPKGLQVTAGDQFGSKTFDIKKPKHLCYPANVNGSGIKNPTGYLMCYQAKPAKDEPKFTPVPGIKVANEFTSSQPQPESLDAKKEAELCVASIINPICGDNTVNQASEVCDGTDDSACPGQCSRLCQCKQQFPFVLDPPNSQIQARGVSALGSGIDNNFTFSGLSGTVTLNLDGSLGPGLYGISVPVSALPPLDVNISPLGSVATVCVFLVEDPALPGSGLAGTGVLNCFGGTVPGIPSPDFNAHEDHCTNGTACDSGTPTQCTGDLPGHFGKPHALTGLCVPAAPSDPGCTQADALTGTIAKLESGADPHPGVCNSPLYGVFGTQSWNAGDAVLTLNAAVEVRDPGDPCTGSPTSSAIRGPLTTHIASSTIMDAFPDTAPAAGKVQAITANGAPFTCHNETPATPITTTSGVRLVTAVAALDLPLPSPFGLADLNLALILTAQ